MTCTARLMSALTFTRGYGTRRWPSSGDPGLKLRCVMERLCQCFFDAALPFLWTWLNTPRFIRAKIFDKVQKCVRTDALWSLNALSQLL